MIATKKMAEIIKREWLECAPCLMQAIKLKK